jgi:outer membrane protein
MPRSVYGSLRLQRRSHVRQLSTLGLFMRNVLSMMVLTLLCAVSQAEPATVTKLSLRQCVQLGIKNHPDLDVARADVGIADARITVEHGPFDPVLQVGLGYTGSRGPMELIGAIETSYSDALALDASLKHKLKLGGVYSVGFGLERDGSDFIYSTLAPRYVGYLSLSFSQPLLNGAWRASNEALIVSARRRKDAKQLLLVSVAAAHIEKVVQAYWDLVLAVEEVKITKELVRSAQEQYELTMKLFRGGKVSKPEVIQAEAAIGRRKVAVDGKELEVLKAERALLALIYPGPGGGWNLEAAYRPADPPKEPSPSVDISSAIQHALKRRPEIAAARVEVEEQQALIARRKSALLPSLQLDARVKLRGLGGSKNPSWPDKEYTWNVAERYVGNIDRVFTEMFKGNVDFYTGLTFSIPLGNSTAKGEYAGLLRDVSRVEAKVRLAAIEVSMDVMYAVKRLRRDAERLKLARIAVELAKTNLKAEKGKFIGGVSSNFDVLRVQDELAQARSNEVGALVSLVVSEVRFQRAIGEILSRFGVRVVAR